MEPLENYARSPFIFGLFFIFCLRSAEVECLPYNRPLTPPTESVWLQRVVPSTLQAQNAAQFPRPRISRSLQATVPGPLPGADPVVQRLCNITDYSDLCFSSLEPFLAAQGSKPVNDAAVLKMLIKASSNQIEQATDVLLKHYVKPYVNDRTARAIMDCKELYSHGLDNLRKATIAVGNKDVESLKIQLSAAITDAETCEDGFGRREESPLADVDRKIQDTVGNCLAVASAIKL